MEVIRADHHRRLQLAGVEDPVERPVDITQEQTGFAVLRSLRIYRFKAGSVIDGHAEEDEVLIIVLAGSAHLRLSDRDLEEDSPEFALSSVDDSPGTRCAAYLPPHGAYRLTPRSDAEVAYARATPSTRRAPTSFLAKAQPSGAGSTVLFEETAYPQHLRLRVVQITAAHEPFALTPLEPLDSACEALVHVKSDPPNWATTLAAEGTKPIALQSWDTVSLLPGERPTLYVAGASRALLLVVLASV